MAKRKKKVARKKKAGRRKATPRAASTNGGGTRITRLLQQKQKQLTKEALAATMAALPGTTTMGDVVSSVRAAGLARDLDAMTLREFVNAIGGSSNAKPAARGARKAGPGRPRGSKKLNTRTDAGRNALDAEVTAFLQGAGGGVRAEDVRRSVGGTPAQVRQSLTRLMDGKKVKKSGQKRGTTYAWNG